MINEHERMQLFAEVCRKAGLKVTPQRNAVYNVLLKATDHPSAEVVCKRVREQFPSVSLDTVNRTLLTLSEIGIAFIVEGTGEVRRYDANLGDHQHFKCVKCKRIVDFKHAPFDNIDIPDVVSDKFKVLRHTVYFEGLCEFCKDDSQVS